MLAVGGINPDTANLAARDQNLALLATNFTVKAAYSDFGEHLDVVAPTQVPWGQKAFAQYLGDDAAAWKEWDAVELVRAATERLPLLIDQGDADDFLDTQLRPELLRRACSDAGHPLHLRMRAGYDHSYYFIASFIGEHIAHHAAALRG